MESSVDKERGSSWRSIQKGIGLRQASYTHLSILSPHGISVFTPMNAIAHVTAPCRFSDPLPRSAGLDYDLEPIPLAFVVGTIGFPWKGDADHSPNRTEDLQ